MMAALAALGAKVASMQAGRKANTDKSKKNTLCRFFWQGQCNVYKACMECDYGHIFPEDKSKKHIAHPYT
eukprot:5953061-Karenia_brevis.AAC.1